MRWCAIYRVSCRLSPENSGAGGKALNRWKTTSNRIAKEINKVSGSQSVVNKAVIIGESERQENGVARAVKVIEEVFN
ncbi:MAG TPA: hypothetical protein ENI77_04550 [Nitrospirae bacterium]|nr:hypothetical protein [Nitrospirota bacterium]